MRTMNSNSKDSNLFQSGYFESKGLTILLERIKVQMRVKRMRESLKRKTWISILKTLRKEKKEKIRIRRLYFMNLKEYLNQIVTKQ